MLWPDMSIEQRMGALQETLTDKPQTSASTIAARLGTSKNAILGFMNRNKDALPRREPRIGGSPMHKNRAAPTARAPYGLKFGTPVSDVPLLPADVDATAFQPLPGAPTPKSLNDVAVLRHDGTSTECHWPVGDGPILFCGCATDGASRYCAVHKKRSGKMVPRLVLA